MTIKALIQPFADLDLRLDNLKYEKFDKENVFVATFSKQAQKVIKQWKDSLTANIWLLWLQAFADQVSKRLIDAVKKMKLSLLGALFFENVVTKLKKFFQKEAGEVKNQV